MDWLDWLFQRREDGCATNRTKSALAGLQRASMHLQRKGCERQRSQEKKMGFATDQMHEYVFKFASSSSIMPAQWLNPEVKGV